MHVLRLCVFTCTEKDMSLFKSVWLNIIYLLEIDKKLIIVFILKFCIRK